MKERPILMNAEMVRATLDGRKTQTRRVVKKQPSGSKWKSTIDLLGKIAKAIFIHDVDKDSAISRTVKCPYGKVGDRLWVRETWQPCGPWDCLDGMHIRLKADRSLFKPLNPPSPFLLENDGRDGLGKDGKQKWRPSIFMPRWASRINLEITDIRVERVQDIDEMGALEEGTPTEYFKKVHGTYKESHQTTTGEFISGSARDAFSRLWDSINAARGYSWESNPWVWVIDFKVIK